MDRPCTTYAPTFSNIEHQSIQYVVDCTRPNAVRWERAIRRQLMSPADRARFYPRFNLEGLLRGDMASRYLAYAVGRQGSGAGCRPTTSGTRRT